MYYFSLSLSVYIYIYTHTYTHIFNTSYVRAAARRLGRARRRGRGVLGRGQTR